ncbi:MAG: hypothetical protein ACLGI8_05980, partial [Acidimicrobiia bacterium]
PRSREATMAVTEQQRHRLLTWFEEHMGPDLGATMMDLMPPADASALATKADLALLRADIAEVRAEIRADVKEDLLQLQRTFGTWLFASQAAVIAVVGVVTAVT